MKEIFNVLIVISFCKSSLETHQPITPDGISVTGTDNEISQLGQEIEGNVFPVLRKNPPATGMSELRGVVKIKGTSSFPFISGILTFHQLPGQGPVIISGTITGLPRPGLFGMHFHQNPAPSPGICDAVGEHLNPFKARHGDKDDAERHLGDLGNIVAQANGLSHVVKNDWFMSLRPGRVNSVVGRPLVIHIRTDDLGKRRNRESRKSGNSGTKIACGNLSLV